MSRATSKRADWISLIEAGYSLEGSERQWLDNLYDCADGVVDPSGIRLTFTTHLTPTACKLGLVRSPKFLEPLLRLYYSYLDELAIDIIYRQGRIINTGSICLFRINLMA